MDSWLQAGTHRVCSRCATHGAARVKRIDTLPAMLWIASERADGVRVVVELGANIPQAVESVGAMGYHSNV
jgi:hypothetical protein